MAKFSDIAAQSAYGNSLIVQRYHGGMATTLVNGITLGDLASAATNVVYLCPIPWQARITDISYVLSADGTATAQPVGHFYVRGMKDKTAKTSTDLTTLNYTPIIATTNDTVGSPSTLAGWTVTATQEYPLYENVTIDMSSSTKASVENKLALPFAARTCTCSEACAFPRSVTFGAETKTINVFGENALGIADKEHYGMLTWYCKTEYTAGTADTKILIKVTYVEPSPSGIVTGKIASNS